MTALLRCPGHVCNARCHDGHWDTRCRCVCGGRYHGVGSDRAPHLVAEDLLAGTLESPLRTHALTVLADLGIQVGQPPLPGMPRLGGDPT